MSDASLKSQEGIMIEGPLRIPVEHDEAMLPSPTLPDVGELVAELDKMSEFYRYRPVSRDEVPALEEMTSRETGVLFRALDQAAAALTAYARRVGELEEYGSRHKARCEKLVADLSSLVEHNEWMKPLKITPRDLAAYLVDFGRYDGSLLASAEARALSAEAEMERLEQRCSDAIRGAWPNAEDADPDAMIRILRERLLSAEARLARVVGAIEQTSGRIIENSPGPLFNAGFSTGVKHVQLVLRSAIEDEGSSSSESAASLASQADRSSTPRALDEGEG